VLDTDLPEIALHHVCGTFNTLNVVAYA